MLIALVIITQVSCQVHTTPLYSSRGKNVIKEIAAVNASCALNKIKYGIYLFLV